VERPNILNPRPTSFVPGSRGPEAPWLRFPKGAIALWSFQGGEIQEGREIEIPPLLALSLCGSTAFLFVAQREMGWNPPSALRRQVSANPGGPPPPPAEFPLQILTAANKMIIIIVTRHQAILFIL